jgi:UV excision repair protein RAD23
MQSSHRYYSEERTVSLHNSAGKILKDEDTVESYKIEEKGFVVCVVNKVCLDLEVPRQAKANGMTVA